MALLGYEQTKAKIETQITAIRKALGAAARSYTESGAAVVEELAPARKRRKLSAKARKAISLAQKKRWRLARAAKATKKTTSKKRPRLSVEDRAKISGGPAKAMAKNKNWKT